MEIVGRRAPSFHARHGDGCAARAGVWSGGGLSLLLVATGVAPFAAGFIASRSKAATKVTRLLVCPLRALTGVPCPSCGATRAFVAAAGGDGGWRRGNAPLVWYAASLVAAGAALAAMPDDRRNSAAASAHEVSLWLRRRPVLSAAVVAVVAAPPWLSAFAMSRREGGA